MSPVNRALFLIERNLHRDLSLGGIADACGVSRFHLAHAFGDATGVAVMEYVRRRRLTESACALASGATDIMEVALDYGYDSHEGFTRAFKSCFGRTFPTTTTFPSSRRLMRRSGTTGCRRTAASRRRGRAWSGRIRLSIPAPARAG